MKHLYIVNSFNNRKRTDRIIHRLKAVSDEMGRDYEILVNKSAAEAAGSVEAFKESSCVITAIGGDGSINRILNDIAGTDNILSWIPLGTGNDYNRAWDESGRNGIYETDIVKINGSYFINAACFGIDADIANDDALIHSRFIPRKMRFNVSVIRHFLTYGSGRRLKVSWDGGSEEKDYTTVIAANSSYYGGGYHISPGSVPDDGVMELVLADQLGKINMARTILSIKNAGHLNNPAVRMIRTKHLTVSSPVPLKANIDGESLLSDRFELEVIKKGIKVEFDREFTSRFLTGL